MADFLSQMIGSLGQQAGAANAARQQDQMLQMEMMLKGFRPPDPASDPLEAAAAEATPGPRIDAVQGMGGAAGEAAGAVPGELDTTATGDFGPEMPMPADPAADGTQAGPGIMDTLMSMFGPQQPTDFTQWVPSEIHPELAETERQQFNAEAAAERLRMTIRADAENYRKLNESKERLAKIDFESKRDLAFLNKAMNYELDQSLMKYRTDMTNLERQRIANDFSKGVMNALNQSRKLEWEMKKVYQDPTKATAVLQGIAQQAELVDAMYAKIWGFKVDSGLGKWIARWTNPAYAKALDQLGQMGANAFDLYHQGLREQAEATPGTGAHNSRFQVGQAMEEDDSLAELAKDTEEDLASGETMLGLVGMPGGADLSPTPAPGTGPMEHPIQQRLREMRQEHGIQ